VKEGDAFAPGDVLCLVETDKATVDFEAQEEVRLHTYYFSGSIYQQYRICSPCMPQCIVYYECMCYFTIYMLCTSVQLAVATCIPSQCRALYLYAASIDICCCVGACTEQGYIAKILVQSGTPDVPVSSPIMITVDDQKDVAAFKDYTSPDKAAAPTKEAPPKVHMHIYLLQT
jgi:Biotin-requiring enzyme